MVRWIWCSDASRFFAIALARLLVEQVVDLGQAAVSGGRTADHERLDAGRGVAAGRGHADDQPGELLGPPGTHERHPLHAPLLGADAHRGEATGDRLAHRGDDLLGVPNGVDVCRAAILPRCGGRGDGTLGFASRRAAALAPPPLST
jgi:hypothetical protein